MSDLNQSSESNRSNELEVYMNYYRMTKDFLHPSLGIIFTIICILGMLANILNIAALSAIIRKSKLPVYRCFLGLAVADFMALLFMSVFNGFKYLVKSKMVIDNTDIRQRASSQPYNTIFYLMPHLINVAFAASNWCVVTMSSFRCIAVYVPLWYQQHCTTVVVSSTLVIVYLFSIIINIPSFIVTRFDKELGLFKDETPDNFNPKIVSLLVIQGLPMVITSLLVIALISKLCSRPAIERSASNAEYRSRDRLQTSVTLVCISAFFVVCVMPSIVYFAYQYYNDEKRTGYTQYQSYKVYTAVDLSLAINYTANFCFYVLLNARLRRKLKHILCCSQGKGSRRDQSHSYACVTQQSTLSGFATSELVGEQSSVGWSASMYNGSKKKKSADCMKRGIKFGSVTSRCSFTSGETNGSRNSSWKRPSKTTDRVSLCNIVEDRECDPLMRSGDLSKDPSVLNDENANNFVKKLADIKVGSGDKNVDSTLSIGKTEQVLYDQTSANPEGTAPVATMDTMQDLVGTCAFSYSL